MARTVCAIVGPMDRERLAAIAAERKRSQKHVERARIVALTCGAPPGEATHWTGRAIARAAGISPRSVQRIGEAHQLQPHRVCSFKCSPDPKFAEKLVDIVGLHLAPPARAAVPSIGEKSQIQALDRTQSGLPLMPGRCGTMTHDCGRHGTTTLFAALDVLTGRVFGRRMQRHRHAKFIRFLDAVEREVPPDKRIGAVVDNDAIHKHPKMRAWLERHPRWTFHFTPTSSSSRNAVESLFSKPTRQRIRCMQRHRLVALQATIKRCLAQHNASHRPFVWTTSASTIGDKFDSHNAANV